jgi:hypothetical protein
MNPRSHFDGESQAIPEPSQQLDISGLAAAEVEVLADEYCVRPDPVSENISCECLGCLLGERAIERQNESLPNSLRAHIAETLVDTGQKLRRAFGREHLCRVWMECKHGSRPSAISSQLHDTAQYSPMSGVNAVEIANADGAPASFGANLLERPVNPEHLAVVSYDKRQTIVG